MSQIQAILFDKSAFSTEDCRRWLRAHDYSPVKRVDVTPNWYRYRLAEPTTRYVYRTKQISDHISLIIGYPSKKKVN